MVLKSLNWEYKYGSIADIPCHDIIYSASVPVDTSQYTHKFFIFGPQFSTFPNQKIHMISNTHDNCVYIQPSEWVVQLWISKGVTHIPVIPYPFPVDTDKFKPLLKAQEAQATQEAQAAQEVQAVPVAIIPPKNCTTQYT